MNIKSPGKEIKEEILLIYDFAHCPCAYFLLLLQFFVGTAAVRRIGSMERLICRLRRANPPRRKCRLVPHCLDTNDIYQLVRVVGRVQVLSSALVFFGCV